MNKSEKKNKEQNNSSAGFTLLEAIFCLFVLTVTVFSSFALIEQTVRGTHLNQSRLAAYYLAQGEVENIKNIRDNNYLNNETWNNGIDSQSPEPIPGFSEFKREININATGEDLLEIEVIIRWNERGKDYEVEVINHLYNWYK